MQANSMQNAGRIWRWRNNGALFALVFLVGAVASSAPSDIKLDEKAKRSHRIDSFNILVYVSLVILTVLTIWMFKHRRARYLHETGLAVIYGLIVGAIIRYGGQDSEVTHLAVVANAKYNSSVPPDTLWLSMRIPSQVQQSKMQNKTFAYMFRGEVVDVETNEIDQKELDQKATFDPEIFFNILLPPVIFSAGYSLKRRHFFRNLGTIMMFALVGTVISCFVTAAIIYGFMQLMSHLGFTFNDCLYFGAIISATDPVTVLAIFNDLHVDVTVYALVFGESVLNDAVAIAMSSAIQDYEEKFQTTGGFETSAFFRALGSFLGILCGSFAIGTIVGCCTALLTKFTKVCEFPLLETALFVLMSYSSFLMAEAADLTGIVAVLFCGMCQAHYTYNNLSPESRTRTKQFFELLNFLAENFIFSYIGVSMFTFQKHNWDAGFICVSFLAIAVARALNIYPLSFLLNLGRSQKITVNFQHMLFFSGLRGAMAFALAIRNTLSVARQTMLTTTSIIVMVTVIVCGGFTTQTLSWLGIPVGVEDDHDMIAFSALRTDTGDARVENKIYEKAWLVRKWYNFDVKFMKPLLTHSRPTLLETLPVCCTPLARILTTTQQLSQPEPRQDVEDSDVDICIDETDYSYRTFQQGKRDDEDSAALVTVEGQNFM